MTGQTHTLATTDICGPFAASSSRHDGEVPSCPHFMLIPSLACPASCSYCFGPHHGPIMNRETLADALDFMGAIVSETDWSKIKVTFHGGEPLMAGHDFWRQALEGLAEHFGVGACKLALQSNLWLLDDTFCALFREHRVEIGTSLDGPREITDSQRGIGYFDRTMAGIVRARSHSLDVGCIATFTPASLHRWREVFDFFLAERLGFSIHPAVQPLDRVSPHALTPAAYGELLRDMLDAYVEHRRDISISSLDQMCRGVGGGEGKVCTFRDCLGMFLAIDPQGDIFACQRFAGRPEFRLGTLADRPSLRTLLDSPVARRFSEREVEVKRECGECEHLAHCKGGCAYNAWAGGNGQIRDPYCEAYRGIFGHIRQRLLDEMGTEENIAAVAERPWDGRCNPLLKKGPLIELAREGPHPSQIARTAKRIVAAIELARGPDIPAVAAGLLAMGICWSQDSGEASLRALEASLHPPAVRLNNLYVHLTFRCQLACTHCYARADASDGDQPEMPVASLVSLIHQAKHAGFRQVILTGGEPLIHSRRDDLLAALHELRAQVRPMNLVLRTNLALPLDDDTVGRIAAAVDQVVASVDGNEVTHDARRGPGTYAALVNNLERYQEAAKRMPSAGEHSLACVMRAHDIQGEPGQAVYALAARLGVRRTRFRPLLPLGRAADCDEPPASEALGAHSDPMELIGNGFQPVASCGLGQNLYVEPSGESFPCYAYHREHAFLGNVLGNGLQAILDRPAFRDLARHTVDTNAKCRTCAVRYLCGGACRAWGGEATQYSLDAAPPECGGLRDRAEALLRAAIEYLELGLDGEYKEKEQRLCSQD